MREVKVDFEYQQRQAKLNGWADQIPCRNNPAPYTDFPDDLPTVAEAEALCDGCPMRKLCHEYGYASRAGLHYPIVLGGRLWVDAKPVTVDGYIAYDQDLAA